VLDVLATVVASSKVTYFKRLLFSLVVAFFKSLKVGLRLSRKLLLFFAVTVLMDIGFCEAVFFTETFRSFVSQLY